MITLRTFTSASILVLTAACASSGANRTGSSEPSDLQNFTSGEIGCPPLEIEISDYASVSGGRGTWQATCRGKTFFCGGLEYVMHGECTEAIVPPTAGNAI